MKKPIIFKSFFNTDVQSGRVTLNRCATGNTLVSLTDKQGKVIKIIRCAGYTQTIVGDHSH